MLAIVFAQLVLSVPLGLDAHLPAPEENPLSAEKIILGRKLFFDERLSADGSTSCASCHDPKRAFSDGRPVAEGIRGQKGSRNTPALINRGYGSLQFLDGRVASLEQQALEPIFNTRELGLAQGDLIKRTGLAAQQVANALASYVRTIRSGDSPIDRYLAGDRTALSPEARSGLALFRGKAGCALCHTGPNFTDEQFHNTGIAWDGSRFRDEGRFVVTRRPEDRGAFRTPTLREIALTAPYMHDGSLATLDSVLEFYERGGRTNPHLDPVLRRLDLSASEKQSLISFLHSLSGRIREGLE